MFLICHIRHFLCHETIHRVAKIMQTFYCIQWKRIKRRKDTWRDTEGNWVSHNTQETGSNRFLIVHLSFYGLVFISHNDIIILTADYTKMNELCKFKQRELKPANLIEITTENCNHGWRVGLSVTSWKIEKCFVDFNFYRFLSIAKFCYRLDNAKIYGYVVLCQALVFNTLPRVFL